MVLPRRTPVRGSMQLYDVSGGGLVMQAVHVLCDDVLRPAHALHLSQSKVRSVGLHCSKLMPSSKASGPVPGPPLFSCHELQNIWLSMK